MVKKPVTLFLVIIGIFLMLILAFKLSIEKEKQKAKDDALAAELVEEQDVQDSVRYYILSLKKHDIEQFNSVVQENLKLTTNSPFYSKIMSNVIDARYIGDNLSAVHLKKTDQTVTVKVKYEITFKDHLNPEGIYSEGKNNCKVLIDLSKIDNRWIIKKVYNLSIES